MEGEIGVKIDFGPKKDSEKPRALLSSELFLTGRLFASQDWADKRDINRAKAYVKGDSSGYPNNPVIAYSFINSSGETCYLVGDGHHRTAEGILQSMPVEGIVDAKLGTLNEDLLANPNLAAQKLGLLGLKGIWPFQVFMEKLVKQKTQMSENTIK